MKKLLAIAAVVVSAGMFWGAGKWVLDNLGRTPAVAPQAAAQSNGTPQPGGIPHPDPVAASDGQPGRTEVQVDVRSGWCLTRGEIESDGDVGVTSQALGRAIRSGDWPRARWLLLAGAKPPGPLPPGVERRLERERLTLELYQAAARGDAPKIRDLIKRGADPNVEVGHRVALTPLAWAATCNWPDAVRALVDGGAEVDGRFAFQLFGQDVSGSTALIWASLTDSREAIEVLIGAGADVNARETVVVGGRRAPGRAPLDAAIDGIRARDLLLAAGADPNVADSDGVTLLMVEAQGGDVLRIQQLLDAGADPRRRDAFGMRAEDHALALGHSEAAALLRPSGDRTYAPAPNVTQGDQPHVGFAQVVQSVERQAPCPGVTKGPGGRLYSEASPAVLNELRAHGYRNVRFEGKSCVWRIGWLSAPGGRRFQILANHHAFGASTLRGTSRILVLDERGRYLGQYLVDSLEVWIEGASVRFDETRYAGDRLTFNAAGPPLQATVDGSAVEFRTPDEPPQGPLNP